MQNDKRSPVFVKAKIRFAVLGPGIPNPTIVMASGEDVSDLAGYYSLREAGLNSVIDDAVSKRQPTIPLFLNIREEDHAGYYAIDIWHASNDGRDEMYSLIFERQSMSETTQRIIADYKEPLMTQLNRLIAAYLSGNLDEVKYIGQMLSTFLVALSNRIADAKRSREARRKVLNIFFMIYLISIMVVSIATFFKFTSIHIWSGLP